MVLIHDSVMMNTIKSKHLPKLQLSDVIMLTDYTVFSHAECCLLCVYAFRGSFMEWLSFI